MTEIGFYHLTRTALEMALPKLLGRVLSIGGRAVVRLGSAERLASLDTALWLCPDPDWLPHGTPAAGDAAMQPIWLTLEDDAPNGARHLFLADGTETARAAEYERIFDLFDGNDPAALEAARRRYREAREAGHVLTYWQQGPDGWVKRDRRE